MTSSQGLSEECGPGVAYYIKHLLGPGPILQIGLCLYQPGFGQETEVLQVIKQGIYDGGFAVCTCGSRLNSLREPAASVSAAGACSLRSKQSAWRV